MNLFAWAVGTVGAVAVTSFLAIKNNKVDPVDIEELAGSFSNSCDDIILEYLQENKNHKYVSGVFKLALSEDEHEILINADMYFQDASEQWIKKTNNQKLKRNVLTEMSLQELEKSGVVQFELTPPLALASEKEE